MKKIFRFALLFMFVGLFSSAMVSCSDDDQPQEPFYPDMTKSSLFTYKLNVSQDLLDVANVRLSWTDSDGELQSELMTDLFWEESINVESTKTTSSFTVTYELKDDIEYKEEPYVIMNSCSAQGSILGVPVADPTAEYQILETQDFHFQNSLGIKSQDLQKYLDKQAFTLTIHIDGDFIDIHKEKVNKDEETDSEENA